MENTNKDIMNNAVNSLPIAKSSFVTPPLPKVAFSPAVKHALRRSDAKPREFNAADYFDAFEMMVATTEKQKEESYKLRYQVYCVENPYENPEENPNQMETDGYDARADCGLLIHKHTGLVVGSTRMIMPLADNWEESFSTQSLCENALLHKEETVLKGVECSRICIPRKMRREMLNISNYPQSYDTPTENENILIGQEQAQINLAKTKSMLPYMSLGLFRLTLEIAVRNGKNSIFATLDPRLLKFLTQLAIVSERLGPDVEHHGIRSVVRYVPIQVFENTFKHKREVWKIISNNGELHDLALHNNSFWKVA